MQVTAFRVMVALRGESGGVTSGSAPRPQLLSFSMNNSPAASQLLNSISPPAVALDLAWSGMLTLLMVVRSFAKTAKILGWYSLDNHDTDR